MKINTKYKNLANLSIDDAKDKEWIITNGIGGYSSSSICCYNHRKYHGLLVASLHPPTDRRVLVTQVEEHVCIDGSYHNLSVIKYKSDYMTKGFRYYDSFTHNVIPSFRYLIEGQMITKEILMPQRRNEVFLRYTNESDKNITLQVRPFLTDRDYHSIAADLQYDVEIAANKCTFTNQLTKTSVVSAFDKGTFISESLTFKDIAYETEMFRGHEWTEDNFSPGFWKVEIPARESVSIAFGERKVHFEDFQKLKQSEKERQESIIPNNVSNNEFLRDLIISSDQFVVERHSIESKSVIAGYHWFTDWGRDTMIAIRGLAIPLGKQSLARDIISTFLLHLNDGMIPNRFPDSDEHPEYNTIDATLWMFCALYEYDEAFSDKIFIESIITKLRSIILYHIQGTRYNIHVTEEGFLYAGDEKTQLTWMDAIYGDHAFTPRWSCAVEINALWYNALCTYNHFINKYQIGEQEFNQYIDLLKMNFVPFFFNRYGYLNDLVNPGNWIDKSIRPNQIFALVLPFSLLDKNQSLSILQTVKEHLYTPLGLRTLSPSHPDFVPKYNGNQWDRDSAYHQGTTWPFLLGEYFYAYLKVHEYSEDAKAYVLQSMSTIKEHFYMDNGIHAISEIFDGNIPEHHEGKGCIQQAWSVSTMIRALLALERN